MKTYVHHSHTAAPTTPDSSASAVATSIADDRSPTPQTTPLDDNRHHILLL